MIKCLLKGIKLNSERATFLPAHTEIWLRFIYQNSFHTVLWQMVSSVPGC